MEPAVAEDATKLRQKALIAVENAANWAFHHQREDGHWVGEVLADVTFTSQYIFFRQAIGLDLEQDKAALIQWLLSQQQNDGSWSLAPESPGNLSTTVEAYLALKILGLQADSPELSSARRFLLEAGGVYRVRFFTRFFLATFGLIPWAAIPQLPMELILMPAWSPVNIYTLSSWARATLIPLLVVRHHEPVYALPNGFMLDNDFLDEIWVDPKDKMIPYAPPLGELCLEQDWIKLGFTFIDKIIALLGGLKYSPSRPLAKNECLKWILEHQESNGDWAGYWPPLHGCVWALLLEGYSLESKPVFLGLQMMEHLSLADGGGKRIQATVSPVWDTVLMLNALCDGGIQHDPRVAKAVQWVKDRQLSSPKGDWRIYRPQIPTGGWSFEYVNNWYPDVDDSAVAVLALLKHDPALVDSECISNAVSWILGMQNPDGGWGAFDYNNDKLFLNKIPFSDMDSLCDPSTSDVTGRILECLGFLLAQKRSRQSKERREEFGAAAQRAINFLLRHQETSGAWWGRWGVNFIYGTSNVLRGLALFAHTDYRVQAAICRAISWVKSVQNEDGGWGEPVETYRHPELAGKGKSTPSQTAWSVLSLLPYCCPRDPAISRGISYLTKTQTVSENGGASWPIGLYTGTGFPNVLYLEYTMYQHYFPMVALSKYAQSVSKSDMAIIDVTHQQVQLLSQPHVLIMALGSRGDVQNCLQMAQLLISRHGCRVRFATHPVFRKLIQSHGIEFHSVGGDPRTFGNVRVAKSGLLPWIQALMGELEPLRRSICLMIRRFWEASVDPLSGPKLSNVQGPTFMADVVVSNMVAFAHVHCAEQLQVPLVFIDTKPMVPNRSFPSHLMCRGTSIPERAWWSTISYYAFEFFTWLCIGQFVNFVRYHEYGMSQLTTLWASFRVLKANIKHVGLWSRHLIPQPEDWDSNAIVAGFAHSPKTFCDPPESLIEFLDCDVPVIAISFSSSTLPNPHRILKIIFRAVERAGVKAVFCRGWSVSHDVPINPRYIYAIDEISHDWLIPRVDGFFHHGAAGHVAMSLKHGVPTLIMPIAYDQSYWALRMAALKVGPPAIDHKLMTVESLARSFKMLLSKKFKIRSKQLGIEVSNEPDGSEVAAAAVASSLPSVMAGPKCAVIPMLRADWTHLETGVQVSGAVAACLVSMGVTVWNDFYLPPAFDWPQEWKRVRSRMPWLLVFLETLMALVTWIFSTLSLTSRGKGRQSNDLQHVPRRSHRVETRVQQSEQRLQLLLSQSRDISELKANIGRNWRTVCRESLKEKIESAGPASTQ